MSDLLTRLANRVMPHTDVPICLDLNLLTERDEAMARVDAAQRNRITNDDRLAAGTDPAVAVALAAVHDIEARIRAASIVIRLTGLDRTEYNNIMLANPPRPGKGETYNTATFFMNVARASGAYVDADGTAHPITDAEWNRIDTMITDGEHDRIAQGVIKVNRLDGGDQIRFFGTASETTTDSFGISGSPATSGSPRAASGAGNRPKSTAKPSTRRAPKSSS